MKAEEQRYLVVKGIAGLGNRISCLLTAILYARLSGRRLLVDWRDWTYSGDGTNVFFRYFQCDLCSELDEVPITDSVYPRLWRGHLRESVGEMSRVLSPQMASHPGLWRPFSIDVSELHHDEQTLILCSYYAQIDGLRRYCRGELAQWRSAPTRVILRELLRRHVTLHPTLRQRVDQLKDDWRGRHTVGVHVRRQNKQSRLAAIHSRLQSLLRQQPDLQVFLATDNVQCVREFHERYPDVISTTKWYPPAGDSMHENPLCPDRPAEGAAAVVDLYLLAECEFLIVDESSAFAYIAHLLSRAPEARVFNVQRLRMLPPRLRHGLWWVWSRLHWYGLRAWRTMFSGPLLFNRP